MSPELIPELIQALAWSLFGLGFGYYICHALKEVDEIREVLIHNANGHAGGNGRSGQIGVAAMGGVGNGNGKKNGGTTTVAETQKQVHRDRSRKFVGIFMMLLAVAIGVNAWYSTQQDRKATARESARAACQAEFNRDFAAVAAKRASWADEDKAAEIALWKSFLKITKPGEGRQLLETYLSTTARTDLLRRQNPLPKLDERNC